MTPLFAQAKATQAHGQDAIELTVPNGSSATVLLHGAHVTSWRDAQYGEQLYLSPQASFTAGKAIRGGVPVIFPQFEAKGPDLSLPRHGFARTMPWVLESHSANANQAQCTLRLEENAETLAIWPHRFTLQLSVTLTNTGLDLALKVSNTDTHAWPFSAALHTYLAVDRLADTRLVGLQDCDVLDAAMQRTFHETEPTLQVTDYLDRIYHAGPRQLALYEQQKVLFIESETFSDVVVWNPGAERCAAMSDMPDQDWTRMLCIEAAQIQSPPMLAAGQSWMGKQRFRLAMKNTHPA